MAVVRDYQGPQGAQIEYFVLRDSRGREVYHSNVRRIELRGEMFEDRFVDVVSHVRLERGDEHEMTFFVNDSEVATIPVFVEFGMGGDPVVAAKETFNKALSKGAVVWLGVAQSNGRPHSQAVWYVWTDGKVYVLDGPTEQQVPGLPQSREVTITARSKDLRSRVSEVPAAVAVIPNDSEQFDLIARMALGRRLNLPDGDGALERWRTNCTLLELTPDFGEERVAPAAAGAPAGQAATAEAAAGHGPEGPAAKAAEEDIHVEAQVDQAVYDQLIAEGKSERIARAKAKAAYVRAEKARIRAERDAG
ncbi:MAG: hypothetical protein GEU74_16800 [Nitriliruptorales bacterium]|nr:hypothetical protein [Nitriliruptorales bacterium]